MCLRSTFCYPDSVFEPARFGVASRMQLVMLAEADDRGSLDVHVDVLRRHPEYRGPEYVELGLTVARDGHLTPALIGAAARTGRYELQDLKKVWHYLARFGDHGAIRAES